MAKDEYKKLKLKLKKLQDQIAELGPIMRGSVTIIGTKNKQPYLSLNKNKKTKMIYLGEKKEALGREYSANHKRLLEMIEEMTEINMHLLKDYHEDLLEN